MCVRDDDGHDDSVCERWPTHHATFTAYRVVNVSITSMRRVMFCAIAVNMFGTCTEAPTKAVAMRARSLPLYADALAVTACTTTVRGRTAQGTTEQRWSHDSTR
jgi:hypothetical protein